METSLLVKTIVILSVVFGILVVALVLNSRAKKRKKIEKEKLNKKKTKQKEKEDKPSLDELYKVIRKRTSTANELKKALELIIEHYGKIHHGRGPKMLKSMDPYSAILFTLCRHPNTNKDLILYFDRELEKRNPEYIKEINEALEKGLNSRGA